MPDNAPTNVGVRPGDILAGKYRIAQILGAGGMGVVVAAHHLQLDERVAIKFLLPEGLGVPDAMARFSREARAAVKIKSEHVARVFDVGTLETGAPYMVMEYLEGGDLSAWIRERGALPVEQAVEFVLQACEAIAEAHGLGIVHRDLKPGNLFCIRRPDGCLSIKVLDFGISKLTGVQAFGSDLGMTKTTAIMGSPLYMSPEQFQSARDVDARTDIWSLGVILYELLAGAAPFSGDTLPELCIKIVTQPLPDLDGLRPELPCGLAQAVSRCLEKDRNQRYSNIAELAVALAPFAPQRAQASVERIAAVIRSAGLSVRAPALPPSRGSAGTGSPTETMASWGQTATSPTAKRKLVLVIAAGGVAFIGGLGLLVATGAYQSLPDKLPATMADKSARAAVSAMASASIQPAAAASVLIDSEAPAASSVLSSSAQAQVAQQDARPASGTHTRIGGRRSRGVAASAESATRPQSQASPPRLDAPPAEPTASAKPSVFDERR